VIGGLIALVVVLAAASVAGLALRRRQGRFRPVLVPARSETAPFAPGAAGAGPAPPARDRLSAADLGAPLGPRATLVQFSTEVCAFCGPTRELLTEVAGQRDGIAFIEVDAAARMDLTRQLHILATPTVLVLDPAGGIASRASGPVRKADLLAAVGQVLHPDGETP
jgi:hypothetical protein